jgi:hypothetical protein
LNPRVLFNIAHGKMVFKRFKAAFGRLDGIFLIDGDKNMQLQCQKYSVFFNAFQNPLRAGESTISELYISACRGKYNI